MCNKTGQSYLRKYGRGNRSKFWPIFVKHTYIIPGNIKLVQCIFNKNLVNQNIAESLAF